MIFSILKIKVRPITMKSYESVGRKYFREIKKLCTLKKLFLEIKYSNLQGKMIFQEQLLYFGSQSFLISCYFTKICVHLSVIVAVC